MGRVRRSCIYLFIHFIQFTGFTACTATNPIWFIKTRLQLDHSIYGHGSSALQCIQKVYRQHVSVQDRGWDSRTSPLDNFPSLPLIHSLWITKHNKYNKKGRMEHVCWMLISAITCRGSNSLFPVCKLPLSLFSVHFLLPPELFHLSDFPSMGTKGRR